MTIIDNGTDTEKQPETERDFRLETDGYKLTIGTGNRIVLHLGERYPEDSENVNGGRPVLFVIDEFEALAHLRLPDPTDMVGWSPWPEHNSSDKGPRPGDDIIIVGDFNDAFSVSRWPDPKTYDQWQHIREIENTPIVGLHDELVEVISGKLAAHVIPDFHGLDLDSRRCKGKGKNKGGKAWESPYASIGKKPGQRFNAPAKSGRRNRGRG